MLFLLGLMINLVAANSLIFNNIGQSKMHKPVHSDTFYSKNIIEANTFMASAASSSIGTITVEWPEPGYYYITDYMDLWITTTTVSNCSYSLDGASTHAMEDNNGTDHSHTLVNLKDNMNAGPYVVDFTCTDQSGKSTASTYFWINTSQLDKYFYRSDLGAWKYLASEQSWEGNDNGMLKENLGWYNKSNGIYSLITIFVFNNEDSVINYMKEYFPAWVESNVSIIKIGTRDVYAFEYLGTKSVVWNSGNNLIYSGTWVFENSTPVSIDYPLDIINPYLTKYPGELYELCIPNWIRQDSTCDSTNKKLISYYDSNSCNSNISLPVNNGTYDYCDYCSSNIKGPFYTNWSS